jgi:hypothetical protein
LGEIASVDGGFGDFGVCGGLDKGVLAEILKEIILGPGERAKTNAMYAMFFAMYAMCVPGLAIWEGTGVSSQPMKTYLSYARFTYAYWWQPAVLRSGAKV